MFKTVEYEINKSIHGHKAGDVVKIELDKNGTPLDKTWRRRVKDAKIDNCMSPKKATTKTQTKTEKGN